MSDLAQVPPKDNRRKASVSDTASVSMSTAGAGGVVIWIFQCIAARTLVQPDDTTAILMGGFSLPIFHSARNAIVAWLDRRASAA